MAYFEGQTLAFSHKGGFWKTRYSFTPTCYASVDNKFISTNGKHPDADEETDDVNFWMHESNMRHNNFYGKDFPSRVIVVANNTPSSVKLFKALSIESNSNEWTGMCSTNINPLGSPQNDLQMGDIKEFTTKEGTQYAELPRDLSNSDSNVDYCCRIDVIIDDNTSFDANIPEGLVQPVSATFRANLLGSPPAVSVNGGEGVALFFDGETFRYFNMNGEVFTYTTYNEAVSNNAVYVEFYDGVDRDVVFTGRLSQPNFDANQLSEAVANIGTSVYVVSNPDVNGDPMRGHYIYLDLRNNSRYSVETYAINVDFEPTKLDASIVRGAKATKTTKASKK
mgnify:CR=1 FL=1|tara:strand:+ start:189 stop:1199 length:1011 start_codon:yes stop_codon:yes gene_type:complete